MNPSVLQYNEAQKTNESAVCTLLCNYINTFLTDSESKIWHAHPVWFINDNPIVGYSVQKRGVRLMFWSGADFEEEKLNVLGKKFKDASVFFKDPAEIISKDIERWITKSRLIQWDYKNIVKRKGQLIKIT